MDRFNLIEAIASGILVLVSEFWKIIFGYVSLLTKCDAYRVKEVIEISCRMFLYWGFSLRL